MGCDIHSVAQVYKEGAWRTVAHEVADDERDYDTFAVYANVRNGYGVAGCDTGEGWPPISEPRGLPDGFELWWEAHHGTWMGDHSHSWLTLAELQKAWDSFAGKEYQKHGVLTRKEYEETIALGKPPTHWVGGRFAPNMLLVSQEAIQNGTAPSDYTDVQCHWMTPAHDRLRTMKAHLDELRYQCGLYEVEPEMVRLVFGFDS